MDTIQKTFSKSNTNTNTNTILQTTISASCHPPKRGKGQKAHKAWSNLNWKEMKNKNPLKHAKLSKKDYKGWGYFNLWERDFSYLFAHRNSTIEVSGTSKKRFKSVNKTWDIQSTVSSTLKKRSLSLRRYANTESNDSTMNTSLIQTKLRAQNLKMSNKQRSYSFSAKIRESKFNKESKDFGYISDVEYETKERKRFNASYTDSVSSLLTSHWKRDENSGINVVTLTNKLLKKSTPFNIYSTKSQITGWPGPKCAQRNEGEIKDSINDFDKVQSAIHTKRDCYKYKIKYNDNSNITCLSGCKINAFYDVTRKFSGKKNEDNNIIKNDGRNDNKTFKKLNKKFYKEQKNKDTFKLEFHPNNYENSSNPGYYFKSQDELRPMSKINTYRNQSHFVLH